MKTFALKQTTKVGRDDCYNYEDAAGENVTFHAHPKRARNWIIKEGAQKTAIAMIEAAINIAFIEAKMQAVTIP